jgi:hypothetical protein
MKNFFKVCNPKAGDQQGHFKVHTMADRKSVSVKLAFDSKRNYQGAIKDLCSLPRELPIPIVSRF